MFNWNNIAPATLVKHVKGYFVVPAFSYVAPQWKGASEIALQFNYTATRAFSIKTLPSIPDGAQYVMCVRYRVGATVYRYKLWNNDKLALNNVLLYSNQKIGANFVIEVWTVVDSANLVLSAALPITTSLRQFPTDMSAMVDYADNSVVSSVTYAGMQAGALVPSTGLAFWFSAESVSLNPVSSWKDKVNSVELTQAVGANQPALLSNWPTQSLATDQKVVDFTGSTKTISTTFFPSTPLIAFACVFMQDTWTLNNQILRFVGGSGTWRIIQGAATPEIRMGTSGTESQGAGDGLLAVRILYLSYSILLNSFLADIYNSAGVLLYQIASGSIQPDPDTLLELGGFDGKISDFLGYTATIDSTKQDVIAALVAQVNRLPSDALFDFGSVGAGNEWLNNS